MINPTGKKLEKLLFGIFDEAIKGVDTYNHNGSMWLIFTDEMRWVVEYTKSQTLWYNYYFFKQEMEIIGLDCVENKDLIQKWFESRFLNKLKAQDTLHALRRTHNIVEHTIQNGVKETKRLAYQASICVEDTIQNGVKETLSTAGKPLRVEDTIQNGVKHTRKLLANKNAQVEDTIQNGVKHTKPTDGLWGTDVEDTIQNGVKHTEDGHQPLAFLVEDTIQNGVKHTEPDLKISCKTVEDTIQNGVKHTLEISNHRMRDDVEDTIQNGVKHTSFEKIQLPLVVEDTIKNGVKEIKNNNNNPYSYHHKWTIDGVIQNGVKGITSLSASRKPQVEQTIKNGIKDIEHVKHDLRYDVEDTIQNGVKHTMSNPTKRTYYVDDTIRNGVKETKEFKQDRNSSHGIFKMVDEMPTHIPMVQVQDVIQEGVKETKTVEDGDLIGSICFMNDNNTSNVRHLISDVVQNGVKHTIAENPYSWRNVEFVIENGIKEVIELPELNPDLNGYGEYYSRNKNMKYPFNDIVEDVIKENNKLS